MLRRAETWLRSEPRLFPGWMTGRGVPGRGVPGCAAARLRVGAALQRVIRPRVAGGLGPTFDAWTTARSTTGGGRGDGVPGSLRRGALRRASGLTSWWEPLCPLSQGAAGSLQVAGGTAIGMPRPPARPESCPDRPAGRVGSSGRVRVGSGISPKRRTCSPRACLETEQGGCPLVRQHRHDPDAAGRQSRCRARWPRWPVSNFEFPHRAHVCLSVGHDGRVVDQESPRRTADADEICRSSSPTSIFWRPASCPGRYPDDGPEPAGSREAGSGVSGGDHGERSGQVRPGLPGPARREHLSPSWTLPTSLPIGCDTVRS